MLAEKANLFQDRRDEELIMSSSNPRAHKHVGRGVRNFYYHIWDRVREDAVFAHSFARLSQNSAMKQHILSTGTNPLAEGSPFDSVWDIGLRPDDPEASNPRRWPGKKKLRKARYCRPRRHSHKRGRVGKLRLLSSILHSYLVRRNSLDFSNAASSYGSSQRLPRSPFGFFDLLF